MTISRLEKYLKNVFHIVNKLFSISHFIVDFVMHFFVKLIFKTFFILLISMLYLVFLHHHWNYHRIYSLISKLKRMIFDLDELRWRTNVEYFFLFHLETTNIHSSFFSFLSFFSSFSSFLFIFSFITNRT
jgi:hypothetical protein